MADTSEQTAKVSIVDLANILRDSFNDSIKINNSEDNKLKQAHPESVVASRATLPFFRVYPAYYACLVNAKDMLLKDPKDVAALMPVSLDPRVLVQFFAGEKLKPARLELQKQVPAAWEDIKLFISQFYDRDKNELNTRLLTSVFQGLRGYFSDNIIPRVNDFIQTKSEKVSSKQEPKSS